MIKFDFYLKKNLTGKIEFKVKKTSFLFWDFYSTFEENSQEDWKEFDVDSSSNSENIFTICTNCQEEAGSYIFMIKGVENSNYSIMVANEN